MVAEAAGLAAAIDYLENLGMDNIREHEMQLTASALQKLSERFGEEITIFGPTNTEDRGGVISFALEGVHPHDISQVLNEDNVCIRAGHHCAKPLMDVLGVPATSRASMYIYNDESDIDELLEGLSRTKSIFGT